MSDRALLLDNRHDLLIRGTDAVLQGNALLLAADGLSTTAIEDLRRKLCPEGLSIVNLTYLEEAGALVRAPQDDERRDRRGQAHEQSHRRGSQLRQREVEEYLGDEELQQAVDDDPGQPGTAPVPGWRRAHPPTHPASRRSLGPGCAGDD